MGYTISGEGYAIPFSDAARKKAADTADFFAKAREKRRADELAGTAMTPAPIGNAAASIAEQNKKMGIQDPAQAGGAAQAVPQNQPPIQGAGQQPPVGARRRRGATDAPFSKAYAEGQAATQKWFDTANRNRQNRMAREEKERQERAVRAASARRKTSQINR